MSGRNCQREASSCGELPTGCLPDSGGAFERILGKPQRDRPPVKHWERPDRRGHRGLSPSLRAAGRCSDLR